MGICPWLPRLGPRTTPLVVGWYRRLNQPLIRCFGQQWILQRLLCTTLGFFKNAGTTFAKFLILVAAMDVFQAI